MPTNASEAQGLAPQYVQYARGVLAEEVKFRRDRRQQILSWASSLLVGIIGGSTALASAKQHQLAAMQFVGLYAAIIIVGIFSAGWIAYHYNKEKIFRNESKIMIKYLACQLV